MSVEEMSRWPSQSCTSATSQFGVREMNADRMPQDVNVSPIEWKIGGRRVGVEQTVDLPARKWPVAVASTAQQVR